jgi:hypothetical protein
MSRRDGAIVAWHELPGTAPPQNEPSRRVRSDSSRCAHRVDDWSDEISNFAWQQAVGAFSVTSGDRATSRATGVFITGVIFVATGAAVITIDTRA